MSFDVERYTPSALTLALSERTLPRSEAPPSKDVTASRLRELFTTLREHELESTNALRNFVRTNDDWVVHSEYKEQGIETSFLGQNGEGFHIRLTTDKSGAIYLDDTLTHEEIVEAIRSEAVEFRVLFFDRDAMEYINADADPNESLTAKLNGSYKKNPLVIEARETGSRAHLFAEDPIERFFLDGSHTAYMVSLVASPVDLLVENDIRHAFSQTTIQRARDITEAETHAEEYRELRHQLADSSHWPREARLKIIDRILEIQAKSGYHERKLDWEVVALPAHAQEDALSEETDAWDEHSITAMRSVLSSSAEVLVLESKLRSRAIAAQALKALETPRPE